MTVDGTPRHRRSIGGPVILIALGLIFLAWNFRPGADPWWILWHYWPLILIFLGVGKIWDSYWGNHHPGESAAITGVSVAWIALLALFVIALWHGGTHASGPSGWNSWWNGWQSNDSGDWNLGPNARHSTQAIELQGAKAVSVNIQMPVGDLQLNGGASKLLSADFHYDPWQGTPQVNYTVTDAQGDLEIQQPGNASHWGNRGNNWNLQFGSAVPVDLRLDMGMGQADVRPTGMNLSNLCVHMGAGQLNLDLTGIKPGNVNADIQGGVGQARIRLPKDEGVRVVASGGIGSVNAEGLMRQGDAYVNAAYGKSARNIEMRVNGGVGEIDLIEED